MANEHTPLNLARTRNGMFSDLSLPTAVSSGVAFALSTAKVITNCCKPDQ